MSAAVRPSARTSRPARSPSAPASSATSSTGRSRGRRRRSMCGIIGYIGSKDVVPVLIDGLRRLEYRGYDSAGIGVVHDGGISLRRSAGKLAMLEAVLDEFPIAGHYGIGHTRWATHGRPTDENAHPHRDCTG